MNLYIANMRVAKLSEVTIEARVEVLQRLALHMGVPLLDATTAMLYAYQVSYSHLQPASVDIYTRHIKAFYAWARRAKLIAENPAEDLQLPRLNKARPHPTLRDDLATIFACTTGYMRTAYTLAAFAGLRCGEICRLQSRDINYGPHTTALIHGKGGKERIVPILEPVAAEIGYRRGWIITNNGKPLTPDLLSAYSSKHLHELGIPTTLHSMRHSFATDTVALTHDVLLVKELLGHENLSTAQIYMQADLEDVHGKLAGLSASAEGLLRPRHLSIVSKQS